MKKLLITLAASVFAFSEGYSYYSVDKATISEDLAPYIVSASDTLLWKANGSVDPVYESNVDYFVKVAAGTEASYTSLFGSGTGGYLRNMVTSFEDGASMTLLGSTSLTYNLASGSVFMYKFKLAEGATSASLNLVNTSYNSTFNFSYSDDTSGKTRPAVDSRGMEVMEGVSLNTARGLNIIDNSDSSTFSSFTINGSINTGSASYAGYLDISKVATTINGTANIGTKERTTAGGILTVNNTSLSLGASSVVNIGTNLALNSSTLNTAANSTLNSNIVKLNSSTAVMNGSVAAVSTGSIPTIVMNSGVNTLSAGATNLSNVGVSIENNTTLNIGNSFSLLKLTSVSTTSSLFVDKGITLTVGDATTSMQFSYSGNSIIKGNLVINAYPASGHGVSSLLGNMVVDGGTITQNTENASSYGLVVNANQTVYLKNGARAVVNGTNNYLGINGGVYDIDATSSFSSAYISMVGGGAINFTKTSNMERVSGVLVKDSNATTQSTILSFTKDSSAYEFGKLSALRNTVLTLDLNGAEVHFTGIEAFSNREAAFTLTLNDFAAGLVKIAGLTTDLISTGTFDIGTTGKCTLVGYDNSGKLLDGTWSVDDSGYLFNSALVPEPAEWACIFGAFALALALYRRRK